MNNKLFCKELKVIRFKRIEKYMFIISLIYLIIGCFTVYFKLNNKLDIDYLVIEQIVYILFLSLPLTVKPIGKYLFAKSSN